MAKANRITVQFMRTEVEEIIHALATSEPNSQYSRWARERLMRALQSEDGMDPQECFGSSFATGLLKPANPKVRAASPEAVNRRRGPNPAQGESDAHTLQREHP